MPNFSGGLPPTSPTDLSIENIGDGEIQINFNGANGAEEYIVIRDYLEIEYDSDTLGIFSERPIGEEWINRGRNIFSYHCCKEYFWEQ